MASQPKNEDDIVAAGRGMEAARALISNAHTTVRLLIKSGSWAFETLVFLHFSGRKCQKNISLKDFKWPFTPRGWL